MGRSIVVDESVQSQIEQLMQLNKWFTGVIIGQVTQHKDYVIHIARTPVAVEDEAVEEDENCGDQETKSKQPVDQPASLEQVDEKWVSTHAKQVCRMLPGGLSVIGLFAIAPTKMLQACQVKLKQMMFSVHKSLTKNSLFIPLNDITDRIFLQIDSQTRKLTCTSLDVADGKSTPRPAEWKYQSVGSQWTQLNSRLSVDIPMVVSSTNQSSLIKQLQAGLSDFCQSVKQAVVSIDGCIRDGSELLVSETKGRKGGKGGGGKGKGRGDAVEKVTSEVEIYLPLPSSESHQDPAHSESSDTLRMCGTVTVRAFVPTKATVSDAAQAIKSDIITSICARCELLCEEDDVTEDKEKSAIYNPPVRYFCSSANACVDFCDYAFQDEKEDEIKQRIQELLDITVDQFEDVETNASEDDTWIFKDSDCEETENASPVINQSPSSSSVTAYLGAAVGGFIAIAASGISYLYLSD